MTFCIYYFFRRSEVYYYLYTSVSLYAPVIYVFLKMFLKHVLHVFKNLKIINFIFVISKIVERKKQQNYLLRCKSKFNSNKIFNLFKITKKKSTFRFQKLKPIKFLHVVLPSCFFQDLAFYFSCIFSLSFGTFFFLRLR